MTGISGEEIIEKLKKMMGGEEEIDPEMQKIIDQSKKEYKESEQKYKSMTPESSVFQEFNVKVVDNKNNPSQYSYNNIAIFHYFKGNEIYDLSVNEIMSMLQYYNLMDRIKSIFIKHHVQDGVQGFASGTSGAEIKNLCVSIPNIEIVNHEKYKDKIHNKFECSVMILLHEISHLLGNIGGDPGCEPEADRFALQELPKWLKIL